MNWDAIGAVGELLGAAGDARTHPPASASTMNGPGGRR